MKVFFKKKDYGHTLVELLIAVALLVLVGLGVFLYSITAQTNIKKTIAKTISLNQANIAAEFFNKDAIAAKKVVSSYSTYTTSNTCIILALYPVDSAGNVHICASCETSTPKHYDYIIYSLVGNDLQRIIIPNTAGISTRRTLTSMIVAKNISNSVLFSYEGTDLGSVGDLSVVDNITFTVSVSTGIHYDESESQEITTQVFFRNYDY